MVRRARESKTFLQPWNKIFNMLRIKNKKQNERKKKKLVARCGGACLLFLNDLFTCIGICLHVRVCIRMLDPLELNELKTGMSCQMGARN